MAKASFVAAGGFGTEVVVLNGLCRDRLGLQGCASAVPLCTVLPHTPLPALQIWAVLRTVTTSWQRTILWFLESVCQIRRIGLGQICANNERSGKIGEQFALESPSGPICKPLLPHALPITLLLTSGSCKSLQSHLFQGDSAASGGVCNRNSEINWFPKASWS